MEQIGRVRANYLESLGPEKRTPEQERLLREFKDKRRGTKEQQEALRTYSSQLLNDTMPKRRNQFITYNELFLAFRRVFLEKEGKPLSEKRERLEDYKTILCYLTEDERFFDCENLRAELSTPSFEKGLLIIGGYGNGKSSIMRNLCDTLKPYYTRQIRFLSANEVVNLYEGLESVGDKRQFWKRMTEGGAKCFDDIKTERVASNYGKADLFKEIIERRYESKTKTFITCNYHPGYPGNIKKGLEEFGEKYGGRVFDRLFEMFNIIEFNGKSFRK